MKKTAIVLLALIFASFSIISCQKAKEPEEKKEVREQKQEIKQQPLEAKQEIPSKQSSEVQPEQRVQPPATSKTKEEQKGEESKEVKPEDEFLQSLKSMQIAYVADGDVWIMRGDGSDKKKITNRGDVTILFGWSYDDTRLLFGTGKLEPPPGMDAKSYVSGYALWVINLETAKEQRLKDIETIGAKWVPQKEEISFLAKDESLWIINSNGRNYRQIIKCCASPDAFSPNGSEVAYIDIKLEEKNEEAHIVSSQVWIKNIETNISHQITHKGISSSPRWFPDGKRILFSSERDKKHSLWIINSDGSNPVQLQYASFPLGADMVSPDGKHFIIYSPPPWGTAVIANVETGIAKEIVSDGKPGRHVFFSPDGSYLVYVSKNDEIRIINIKGVTLLKVAIGDQPFWANKWRAGK